MAALESGSGGDEINPGVSSFFAPFRRFGHRPEPEAAYGKWLDQTSERERHGSTGFTGQWASSDSPVIVLLLISVVIFVFMLFFRRQRESAITQGC